MVDSMFIIDSLRCLEDSINAILSGVMKSAMNIIEVIDRIIDTASSGAAAHPGLDESSEDTLAVTFHAQVIL